MTGPPAAVLIPDLLDAQLESSQPVIYDTPVGLRRLYIDPRSGNEHYLGPIGALGGAWGTIAPWTPLGAVMTLHARVLAPAAWNIRDTESLLACAGYIVIHSTLGIRFFRWEAR